MSDQELNTEASRGYFATTHWSVVLTAQDKASPSSQNALETLCRTYWYPLYAYVRKSGRSSSDAQDLTQEFFARFLALDWLRTVAPEKGRFRTFLLIAMKRFLLNETRRELRLKRGGGQFHIPWETTEAEQRFVGEPALAPDELFERRWAMTLLETAMNKLEEEFVSNGKQAEFEHLKEWLTADRGAIPYEDLAKKLQSTPGAARVAVHRLRKRYREVFRETVGETVGNDDEIDSELRHVVMTLTTA